MTDSERIDKMEERVKEMNIHLDMLEQNAKCYDKLLDTPEPDKEPECTDETGSGHIWNDGTCVRCGAAEPDKEPETETASHVLAVQRGNRIKELEAIIEKAKGVFEKIDMQTRSTSTENDLALEGIALLNNKETTE